MNYNQTPVRPLKEVQPTKSELLQKKNPEHVHAANNCSSNFENLIGRVNILLAQDDGISKAIQLFKSCVFQRANVVKKLYFGIADYTHQSAINYVNNAITVLDHFNRTQPKTRLEMKVTFEVRGKNPTWAVFTYPEQTNPNPIALVYDIGYIIGNQKVDTPVKVEAGKRLKTKKRKLRKIKKTLKSRNIF
jgi:hypothetical protein